MMKDFDLVALTKALPEFGLAAGALGTIVDTLPRDGDTPQVFMVEFPGANDENFEDWRVEFVEASCLQVLTPAEYKARRARAVAAE